MKLNFKSIRVKLIISMLMLCLVPLATVGIVTYFEAKSVLGNKLKMTSTQTLNEVIGSLDNYFMGISIQLTQAANNINFNQIDKSAGREVFTQEYLRDMQESSNDIVSAFFATESGKYLIYPNENSAIDINYKSSKWYTLALENNGQATATDPHVDESSGKKVITVVKTVEFEGEVIGVVGMNISLDVISDIFSKSKIGDSGYITISDSKGIVISHPDDSLIGTDTISKQSFWDEVESNNDGFIKYTYKGENKFAAYNTYSLTGWKLIATLKESELSNDVNSIKFNLVISILIAAGLATAVSLLIGNGIGKKITKLKEGIAMAAAGDLTTVVSINSTDELGQLGQDFNTMTANLSKIMLSVSASSKTMFESSSQIAAMAEQTAASIGEVTKAVDEISAGATNQAQNAQISAENIGKLSMMLDDITDLTKEVGSIASDAEKLGENGLKLMEVLSDKSEQTKQSSMNVNKIVIDVNNSIAQINSISDTISDITEQTNLLSLNASIEAARAGEHGKGFAVVADEIRKLADQSKNSTKEIQRIVETVRSKSAIAVSAMESTERIIQEQDTALIDARQTFSEIITGINALAGKMNDIQISTISIGTKKETVVEQIENISSISEETAACTEEVSASAEEVNATMQELTSYAEQLNKLAESLQVAVEQFNLQQ